MVASDAFAEFLREQLASLGRITMRRMFGKTGVFCDGVMFGMVTENTLYFRVDDQNRATFKEAESFPPLNYEKKGCTIDLSFWRAPERLFDEPYELVAWARAALTAADLIHCKGADRARHSARRPLRGVSPRPWRAIQARARVGVGAVTSSPLHVAAALRASSRPPARRRQRSRNDSFDTVGSARLADGHYIER